MSSFTNFYFCRSLHLYLLVLTLNDFKPVLVAYMKYFFNLLLFLFCQYNSTVFLDLVKMVESVWK